MEGEPAQQQDWCQGVPEGRGGGEPGGPLQHAGARGPGDAEQVQDQQGQEDGDTAGP